MPRFKVSSHPAVRRYDRERENIHIVVSAPAGQVRVTHIAF